MVSPVEGDVRFDRAIMAGVAKGFRVSAVIQAMYQCLYARHQGRWLEVSRQIFGPANYLAERAELIERFHHAKARGILGTVATRTSRPDEITINSLKLHYFANQVAQLRGPVEQAPTEKVANNTSPAYERCLVLYEEGRWYVLGDPLEELVLERKRGTTKTRVPRLMGLATSTRCLLGVGAYHPQGNASMGVKLEDLEVLSDPIPYFLYDDDVNPLIPRALASYRLGGEYEAWESIYHTDPQRIKVASRVTKRVARYLKADRIPRKFVPPVLHMEIRRKTKTLRWAPDVVSPRRPLPSDSWLGPIEEEDRP